MTHPMHQFSLKSGSGLKKKKLKNDLQCGLTTGGREECWWDCRSKRFASLDITGTVREYIIDPLCLDDCFPPNRCLNSLLDDFKAAGGICKDSWLDVNFKDLYRTSDRDCIIHEEGEVFSATDIKSGLCSERTKVLMRDQYNCIRPLLSLKRSITLTVFDLVQSLCDIETVQSISTALIGRTKIKVSRKNKRSKRKKNKRKKKKKKKSKKIYQAKAAMRRRYTNHNRLTPIEEISIINGATIASVPPLENTRHRYPWICSLRAVGQQSSHYCAVTLLARPPGPTVLVTSAHCTFLCKSQDGAVVPNCCCPNVGPRCSGEQCGDHPKTTEMTGDEVEIVCGEWDTATNTEEEYNVVLPIEKIIRHPDFQISRGDRNSQFVASDIAVIMVKDENFESLSAIHKIYPACLPTQQLTSTEAIHSGWSTPPPLDFVRKNVTLYEQYYQEFSKQWHHPMDIITCVDPEKEFFFGAPFKNPTNSYYPPGTICATEIEGNFCPTSGESGSPLMVKNEQRRFVATGINSFIKGCSSFWFAEGSLSSFFPFLCEDSLFNDITRYAFLNQFSENPTVYTRLSCYLPWVAAQYDMEFSPEGETHPDCHDGHGDITEVTAEVCRTTPSGDNWDTREGIEAECIFPFTFNGVEHNSCILGTEETFTRPVFLCPIRRIKKYDGTSGTDYTDQHLNGEIGGIGRVLFCPTNSNSASFDQSSGQLVYHWKNNEMGTFFNNQLELDPNNQDCDLKLSEGDITQFPVCSDTIEMGGARPVFSTCKNNCPGGDLHFYPLNLLRIKRKLQRYYD